VQNYNAKPVANAFADISKDVMGDTLIAIEEVMHLGNETNLSKNMKAETAGETVDRTAQEVKDSN